MRTGNEDGVPRFERVNLSGGPNSKHNIGRLFYWLLAKRYLAGALVELGNAEGLMNVLSNTFTKLDQSVPSYMLGWARFAATAETPPSEPEFPNTNDPKPGKHPSITDKNRTYGDPDKERFLRMMAYMRSYVVPDFLAYGEMIRPGSILKVNDGTIHGKARLQTEDSFLEDFDYDYNWEWRQGGWIHLVWKDGHVVRDRGDCSAQQLNHTSISHVEYRTTWDKQGRINHKILNSRPFRTGCLVASAWRRFSPGRVALPCETIHIVANAGSKIRTFVLRVDLSCSIREMKRAGAVGRRRQQNFPIGSTNFTGTGCR